MALGVTEPSVIHVNVWKSQITATEHLTLKSTSIDFPARSILRATLRLLRPKCSRHEAEIFDNLIEIVSL
jgi:hypothetical protein